MSEERWASIPGYEGYYEVSDRGRVRSLDRMVQVRPGVTRIQRGRAVNAGPNDSGYIQVALNREGRRRTVKLHRLVLLAFVGPCPEGMVACHADDDRNNNTLANLRWDTHSANILDLVRNGNHPHARKTHCPKGHGYTADNTLVSRGERICRTCLRERNRLRRARLRSAVSA